MSIFATVAIVCTMVTNPVSCNEYVIDHAYSAEMGESNTEYHTDHLDSLKGDEQGVMIWASNYGIQEAVGDIATIDIKTVEVAEEDIP